MNQTKSISWSRRAPLAGRRRRRHVDGRAGGCANRSASSGVYSYDQAQREQIVRTGTVTGVRPIVIQNDKSSGAGMLAGGALGGVAGNAVGGGTGRTIATVGGAILGALAGNAIENSVGKSSGYEITVRLDNGETRVVAQEADVPISVGQRVQVISGQAPRASPRCKSSSPEKSPRKRFSLARAAQESRWNTAASCWAAGAGFLAQSVVPPQRGARDYPRNAVLFVFSAISAGSFMAIQRLKCHVRHADKGRNDVVTACIGATGKPVGIVS